MSDHHIPMEIQIEIIRRFPLKSVIGFSSVSKQWNSFIHSSKFVYSTLIHTQRHHQRFFIVQKRDGDQRTRVSSFVDDDTFPQNKSIPFLPESVSQLNVLKVAGSSHGLLCLLGTFSKKRFFTDMAVIWNPMIRKSVRVVVPNVVAGPRGDSNFGFGVCPKTCDPKIVKINPNMDTPRTLEDTRRSNWHVEVFTLSSGEWRNIPSPPDKWLSFPFMYDDPVVVDGFIYWLVCQVSILDPYKRGIETLALVSFDLTSEEFKLVYLPDKFKSSSIQIFKFRESLAIYERESSEVVYKVWILMENGALKELLNFNVGFQLSVCQQQPVLRRNGQLIMRDMDNRLVVYKPDSNQIDKLWMIYADHRSSYVIPSTESLLLLDQSDTVRGGGG